MASPEWWPPHAYVPGQNARHPEDLFDLLKASVSANIPTQALHETEAFRAGLRFFHAGFFWECHEVLEAVWMQTPQGSPEREMTQAVIQLANARLKVRMGKPRAVRRLLEMVGAHLDRCASRQVVLGLRVTEIEAWISETANNDL